MACAIASRIDEFVGMPTGGARAGFGFAISDHTTGEEIGIIKDSAVSVKQRVTQTRRLR
jgi:hypothetical protein